MNEKQRQLIDYFTHLPEPTPPRSIPSDDESIEEAVPSRGLPLVPPSPSVDSVRAMLEQRRSMMSGHEAIEESLLSHTHRTMSNDTASSGLFGGRQPVELPLSDDMIELGVRAAEKALNDEEMNPEEQDFLEAIIVPGKRPVLDVIDGDISASPPGWEFLDDFRPLIRGILPSIGRVDVPELSPLPYAGTGFFVGEGLLMTNRHVAELFVQGAGAGKRYLRFLSGLRPQFTPQYEVGDPDASPNQNQYEIIEALLVHPHWDTALLRVQPIGDAQLPKALDLARHIPPNFGSGMLRHIIVVGYPMLDDRNDMAQQMNIFRQIFGRKRLMPGYLTGFDNTKTKWNAVLYAATHDASTLGGNSGSAIVDLVTGQVLALHFGGRYLRKNYGVPAWELAQDERVVALGVNFVDGLVPVSLATKPGWLDVWNSTKPLEKVPPEVVTAVPVKETPHETPVLPVAPDWFERVSDTELLEAMRRDSQTTERLIRETLLPAEADDLIADLQQGLNASNTETIEETLFDFLLGAKPDPTLPEIIFLHGIMGSHLAASGALGGRVWLSPLAFVAGGVARRLTLAEDGEQDQTPNQILYPDGHVRLVYEKAMRKWRMAGFIVHEFAFDWRKPIANSAERLHLFIETLRLERPSKKFALVAHSMGGLVAAVYAARHPEWSSRTAQAIFLGAPLRGSYAPIEGLLGTYPIFPKAAQVDRLDDLDHFMAMARTLPGLIDMLPDPDIFPDAASLYQRITWPPKSAPAQIWLDQSRQLKRILATSPILDTARLIVAHNHPTVAEVTIVGRQLQSGPRSRPGDGTVPTRSAAASVQGVTVYQARGNHGDLPREQSVIDAVIGLLQNGTCTLPPLTQQAIEDQTPIEEAVVETIEECMFDDLQVRLQSGILTQRDVDFFLRADDTTRPGAIPLSLSRGGV